MTHATIVLVFLLLQVSLSCAAADTLEEFSAYYSATTNGIRGTAERHLVQLTQHSYRLSVSLEAKLRGLKIGALEQAKYGLSSLAWCRDAAPMRRSIVSAAAHCLRDADVAKRNSLR